MAEGVGRAELLAEVSESIFSGTAGLGLAVGSGHSAPCEAELLRDLSGADIALAESTALGSTTPSLRRLRDTHHQIARLLAQGRKPVEVAAVMGYSQSRISILQKDPAFQELLEFYRDQTAECYIDVHQRISAVALEATAELHERLVEEPEKIKTTELLEIAKFAHDRTGFGPQTKVQSKSISVHLSGDDLAALKREVKEGHNGHVQIIRRAALPAGPGPEMGAAGGEGAGDSDGSEAWVEPGGKEGPDI